MSETVDETNKLQKPILSNTPGAADTSDDQSTGSSGEGDNSETDPDYNPTKDVNDEDMASKPKKPKTKDEGNNTCMFAFNNSFSNTFQVFGILAFNNCVSFRILFKYSVIFNFTHFLYNNSASLTGVGQCKTSSTRSTPQMTRHVTGPARKKPTNKDIS